MLYINNITSDASQSFTLTGISGIQIGMTLRFMPRIQRWIMGIEYGSFSLDGLAVVLSPNILRQWRNILPFGMTCLRADGLDPYTINDFQQQIANLFLLDAADVAQVEQEWFK